MLRLRPYQEQMVELTKQHLIDYPEARPTIVVPTGGGKSLISAALATHYAKIGNVLIVTFRKELVAQTAKEMPEHLNVSVFSAGIGRKETKGPIIVAGIQSIRNHWNRLPTIRTLLIDEAHWGNATYVEFITKLRKVSPGMRVISMTATPFDGRGIHLHMLKAPITTGVCAQVQMGELLRDGYLCNVVSYNPPTRLDVSHVGIDNKTGDYKPGELQAAVDLDNLNTKVAEDIIRIFAERNSILVFASGVKHAEHLGALLPGSAVMLGSTPKKERDTIVSDFRAGKIRYLVAVDTLLVGFDAPCADGLAMVRPTKSPLVYVQAVGRIMRTFPGKKDALLCDFVGVVDDMGPVDEVCGHPPRTSEGDAPTKVCDVCFTIVFCGTRICPVCGEEFPPPREGERIYDPRTGQLVVSGVITDENGLRWYPVENVTYNLRVTHAGSQALVANYYSPGRKNPVAEDYYLLFDHRPSVSQRAMAMWAKRALIPGLPQNPQDALARAELGGMRVPRMVALKTGSKFPVAYKK